jgi:8-oxo-dGTP diphosphatase
LPDFSPKVAALVIKEFGDGFRLLVHSFEQDPSLPLRFPGGGVDKAERFESALYRELKEEADLTEIKIIRKLGVVRYFKQYSQKLIERHDYLLLADKGTKENWSHKVGGTGTDAGEIFNFRWISSEEFHLIDIELQKFVDLTHIPELFPRIL